MSVFARSLACQKRPHTIVWTCGPANTAGGQLSTPMLQGCRYECPQGGHWRGLTVAPLLKASWSASTLASGAISARKAPGRDSCSFQCWVPHSIVAKTSTAYFKAFSPNATRHLTASWSGLGSGQCAWHVFGHSPAAALLPPPRASGMQTFHLWRAQMCSMPSVSVLFVTVGTGTQWSAGPIFLRASPAQAACSLG